MLERRQVRDAVLEWLEVYKRNSVKALTFDRLMISYNLMLNYSIAVYPVSDVSSLEMQQYLSRLASDGYSMSTIKKQFNLLTAYWKHAMSQGSVTVPVYLGVSLPTEDSLVSQAKEIETYSHDEQALLLKRLLPLEHAQYGVAILMLEAGLRVGEALGLKWEDVLWSRKALRIRRTLIRLSTETGVTYVQDSPKSKTSRRIIPLSSRAFEMLQRMYVNAKCKNFVFSKPDDPEMPYSYSSVEYHIKALCKDLVISYKGMHAFRHTFATNCYERGCDVKILSKLLGHADVAITYNIYIHLYGDELEAMRHVLA